MTLRIGFAGKMGAGKTTAAEFLSEKYQVPVYHFATPIKTIIATEVPDDQQKRSAFLWTWAARLFDGLEKQAEFVRRVSELLEREQDSGRLAQKIGDAGREIDSDVWVRYLMSRIPRHASALVDDVRFPNEVQALKKAGFHVARIEAPELSRRKRLLLNGRGRGRDLEHCSETALDDVDLPIVHNDRTPEILQERLEELVANLSGQSSAARR